MTTLKNSKLVISDNNGRLLPALGATERGCSCGCGERVQAPQRLLPGHAARLRSAVLRVVRGEAAPSSIKQDEATLAYIRLARWTTPEMVEALGI